MYQPPQEHTLTPAGELLTRTVLFYLASFWPLFLLAAMISAVPTLLGVLITPEDDAVYFIWAALLLAVELGAHSAVLWMAHSILHGKGVNRPGALMAIVIFGPRYFAGAFLVVSLAILSVWTVILFPLAIYAAVRLSLYGPAIVVENRNIIEAFQRSWRLVDGRWWRTFGMEMILASVLILASVPLTLLVQTGASVPVVFLFNVLATAVIVPLVMSFFLLLFEDYRRVSDGTAIQRQDPHDRPAE